MKKFLTLALALVMALALAAPAMAFVDFEYTADSEYDLDAYLVDYDTNYGVFSGSGVFTELPAADRGYVTNEMVGAVIELLVPALNDGGDVVLTATGDGVELTNYVEEAKDNKNVSKLAADGYGWEIVDAADEIIGVSL